MMAQGLPFKALWLGILAGGLAALIHLAPAYWVASALSRATQGRVLLTSPEGSVWHGNSHLALSSGLGDARATALPGRIDWQLHWAHWIAFELEVLAPCCMSQPVRAQVAWNWPGLSLSMGNAEIHLSASWLQALGAPWNTVQLLGDLNLKSQGAVLNLAGQEVSLLGQIQLQLIGLSSRLSTVKPLGSYVVVFKSSPTLGLTLSSLEPSRLILQGTGQWRQGRLVFDGVAKTASGDENTLSNLLNVLGQRHGNEARLHLE
jgi:general secretion pathway protein N